MTEDGEVWLCSEEHPTRSGWHCDRPHGHDGDHEVSERYRLPGRYSWPQTNTETIPLCGSTTPGGAQVVACYKSPGHGGPHRGSTPGPFGAHWYDARGRCSMFHASGYWCEEHAGHDGPHGAFVDRRPPLRRRRRRGDHLG